MTVDPDRLDAALQLGKALLQSQGTWPQTADDKQMWADTAVELADALFERLGAPGVPEPVTCSHPIIVEGRCIKCQAEV